MKLRFLHLLSTWNFTFVPERYKYNKSGRGGWVNKIDIMLIAKDCICVEIDSLWLMSVKVQLYSWLCFNLYVLSCLLEALSVLSIIVWFIYPYLSVTIDSLVSHVPYTMMTSSNGNIFRVTGPLCGEFTGPGEFPTQRPVTRSFDVYFDLRLNKRLCKQSRSWWFETLLCPLWRHSNELPDRHDKFI